MPFITVASLFAIKIIGGCINLYIHNHFIITNDIEYYFTQSIKELNAMKHSPISFFKDWIFNWGDLFHHLNMFSKENMPYWSTIGTLIHTKYMTLANIFSLGNEYVDVIIFNVFYFIGQLNFYKSLYIHQPEKKYLFLIVVFFIPSVIFWCSGIHKDGIILSSIGFLCYYIILYIRNNQKKYLVVAFFALLLLFVTRYFYILCILPPLFIWMFTKNKKNILRIFIVSYFIGFVLLFTINSISPKINPLQLISNRQLEFFSIRGYSDMKTPILEPNFLSYVKNFPIAMNHIIFRPYFSFSNPVKYQVSAIDAILILSLITLFSFFIKRKNLHQSYFLFLLFFGLSVYLFIGYTIPNAGALVRYKSEFTVVILGALVGLSEVPFLKKFYSFPII